MMGKFNSTVIVDTTRSQYAKLRPVPIERVHLEDDFWAPRLKLIQEETIPSQYRLIEETGRLFNFRRASGKEAGGFRGIFFNDSDVYKWIEAAAFSYAYNPDQKIIDVARNVISEVIAAQDEDGYLNTYFTFERKADRWKNLRDMHELYCAGHLIQAAVAFYRATGDKTLLNAACRFADHIASVFGPGRRVGVCGHPEIEMALVELYRTTNRREYLDLACFFIDNRGRGVIGGSPYHIDHKPFRELDEVVGHAVRALYLNCGATDVYAEVGDEKLFDALMRLWHNVTERKMYVTGGVGSRHEGEAFGEDYELPNARAYAETCAAIANFMWNWRMLLVTGEGAFADIMELTLYNGILSGVSLDGKHYFYVNPLADRGGHRRQEWFECACCPPNIARLIASLPGYFYSTSENGVWIHLYAKSTAHIKLNETEITLIQDANYPWDGEINIAISPEEASEFSLHVRIPGWCKEALARVNGEKIEKTIKHGYLEIRRLWRDGDKVRLSLAMPIERIVSHPHVMENTDRVALRRGPIVYCLEGVDNPGFDVWDMVLPDSAKLDAEYTPNMLGGVVVVSGEALALDADAFGKKLYAPKADVKYEKCKVRFTAIPYYAWANREPSPMTVWIRSPEKLF
ncbi:MAG: glycoside hydrolase family 127 protein [Candidatus Bathyarchaeia archaeon]